jgi:AcrR family transcriptional regulator
MARDQRRDQRHERLERHDLGEHLRDLVVGKLAEKAAKQRADTEKGRMKAEAIDLITDHISALDLWTRMPPGERRTRITRDELAAAAVRIADTEGFAALSMRRLAAEVGVGTMTLYHYIRNKDELLTLVNDAVMGEVVVPDGDPLPADWRRALAVIATRSRDAFARHPWMFDIADDPPIGPNSVRHFDQTLQAVAGIDVPLAEKLDIAAAVDEMVFGYCLHERNNAHAQEDAEDDMVEYVSMLLQTDAYPTLSALVDELGVDGLWDAVQTAMNAPARFEKHLDLLLDGIAADLARRR